MKNVFLKVLNGTVEINIFSVLGLTNSNNMNTKFDLEKTGSVLQDAPVSKGISRKKPEQKLKILTKPEKVNKD